MKLPTKLDDFKEQHYRVMRRLNKTSVTYIFSGKMALEVDIPKFIPILMSLNFIRISEYTESLELLRNTELKDILKSKNLKASGNKEQLKERIIHSLIVDEVTACPSYTDFYLLTNEGRDAIQESYDKIEKEKFAFDSNIVRLLKDLKLKEAAHLIYQRKLETNELNPLGTTWHDLLLGHIFDNYEEEYRDYIRGAEDKTIAALVIYSELSGAVDQDIARQGDFSDLDFDEYKLKLRTARALRASKRALNTYVTCEANEYRFLASLDCETCPLCGALDGKIFKVKDANIGTNFPPLHNGCRCTTIAHHEMRPIKTRFARDPNTRKGINVPGNITWHDWINRS